MQAGDVGADDVALDDVVVRVGVGDVDAVALVAQDDVAGGGRRPADGVEGRPAVDDDAAAAAAVLAVAQQVARVVHDGRAGVVRPDDRAADHVLGGAHAREDDAVVGVGRDDVVGEDVAGGRAAVLALDRHAIGAVALVDGVPIRIGAGRVGVGVDADLVVVEDDVRGVVDEHAAGVEPVDGQGLDLRARCGDVQADGRAARIVADELDERVGAVVARLGGPVDDHRLGDRRQRGLELDLRDVDEALELMTLGLVGVAAVLSELMMAWRRLPDAAVRRVADVEGSTGARGPPGTRSRAGGGGGAAAGGRRSGGWNAARENQGFFMAGVLSRRGRRPQRAEATDAFVPLDDLVRDWSCEAGV